MRSSWTSPGGSNDLYARLIGQWLSEHLSQQFFVENRPGAGGNLGTEAVANATADGYTLLLAFSGDAWNATLYSNLRFNFVRDFEPVASIARGMDALVVHPSLPVNPFRTVAAAKANPGKITMASAGVGSAPHMCWELFRSMRESTCSIPLWRRRTYTHRAAWRAAQASMPTLVSAIEHTGGQNPYACGNRRKPHDVLPDVPTLSKFVPEYNATIWWGIAAPKNTRWTLSKSSTRR